VIIGRARQGTLRAPHMRGGGRVFGPKYRSHAWRIPRKVRQMALKIALTSKLRDGHLIILDQVRELPSHKTRPLAKLLGMLLKHNTITYVPAVILLNRVCNR
jgi:large subunit ribosomal protein L4